MIAISDLGKLCIVGFCVFVLLGTIVVTLFILTKKAVEDD